MACIKDGGKTYRILELEDHEDLRLVQEARDADVGVDKYIHDRVLEVFAENTMTRNQNYLEAAELQEIRELLLQHKSAVAYIAEQISWFTSDAKPSYWVFDTNLTFIKELLEDLWDVDKKLHQDIIRLIEDK